MEVARAFYSWTTPLLLLAVYGIIRYFAKPGDNKEGKINWTPWESVGVTLAIYFGAQLIGVLLLYAPITLLGSEEQATKWLSESVSGQFTTILLVEVLTVIFLLRFLKERLANLKTIGLQRPKWLDLGYVLVGFGLYFILYIVILNLAKAVIPELDLEQAQETGFESAKGLQLVLVFVGLVVLPPVVEEYLTRGFLYTGLKNKLPIIWAALITSGLFAVAHFQAGNGKPLLWAAAIDTFVLSLVLIYLREKTSGLWAPVGLHALKNSLAFLSIFVFHLV